MLSITDAAEEHRVLAAQFVAINNRENNPTPLTIKWESKDIFALPKITCECTPAKGVREAGGRRQGGGGGGHGMGGGKRLGLHTSLLEHTYFFLTGFWRATRSPFSFIFADVD